MSKSITIIPPSESRPETLRVAAYCRVSTDLKEQASSYASQIHRQRGAVHKLHRPESLLHPEDW